MLGIEFMLLFIYVFFKMVLVVRGNFDWLIFFGMFLGYKLCLERRWIYFKYYVVKFKGVSFFVYF